MERVLLDAFHLLELQFHRRRPPEDRNPDLDPAFLEIELRR